MSWVNGRTGNTDYPQLPSTYTTPPDPLNAVEQPADAPIVDRATIPLIARLVWPDRTEWRAVHARRWTRTHVYVTWPPHHDDSAGWIWLKAEDVQRVIVVEEKPSSQSQTRPDRRRATSG